MIILGIDPGISVGSAIISIETYRKSIVEEAMLMTSYIENKKKLINANVHMEN